MKNFIFFAIMLVALLHKGNAQEVNGTILLDSTCLKVVKVWGTHEERGYACGYLLAEDIRTMFENYIKPAFGGGYSAARNLVIQGNDLSIDSLMKVEAQAMIDGITDAGFNTTGLDCYDVLTGNCMLDLSGLLSKEISMGCSSLMSWGDATTGTALEGTPVITRHLDWQVNSTLTANQVMVIHLPSESDEQPWMLIGFAGMMSALSGVNADLGVFQHVMSDFSGQAQHGKHYIPVWFSLRNALEKKDYNNDGYCNVADLSSSLNDSQEGFADGYIISSVSTDMSSDELTALVAELTPVAPTHTFRTNTYPDSIPGDNLYTANYQIARNNSMHFCSRYNGIRDHIGNGTLMGTNESWQLMNSWSAQASNYQVMQYAPVTGLFRISTRTTGPAYLNDPMVYDMEELFSTGFTGMRDKIGSGLMIYPNPVKNILSVKTQISSDCPVQVRISEITGKAIMNSGHTVHGGIIRIPVSHLKSGMYLLEIITNEKVITTQFFKDR